MSYVLFLTLFIFMPIAAIAFAMRRRIRRAHVLALVGLAAVTCTTPWDNYLVATGVWFYDPRLVLERAHLAAKLRRFAARLKGSPAMPRQNKRRYSVGNNCWSSWRSR